MLIDDSATLIGLRMAVHASSRVGRPAAHCAIVSEVAQATLTLEQVFAAPRVCDQPRIVAATARAAGRMRASVAPATPADGMSG